MRRGHEQLLKELVALISGERSVEVLQLLDSWSIIHRRGSRVTGSGRQLSPRGPNRRGSAVHQATGDGRQGWVDTPQEKTTGKTNPKHRLADDPRAQCFEVRLHVGELWQGVRHDARTAA